MKNEIEIPVVEGEPVPEEFQYNSRTHKQNNAIHLYLEQVAEALNNGNFTVRRTMEEFNYDIPWTKESAKELLWRAAQKSMFGKDSTRDLSKHGEIDKIHDVITRFLGKLGIEYIPFPNIEDGET